MSSENENLAKSKSLVWLYSGIGVVLSFVILVVLNLIVSTSIPVKLDLTEDKVHTLSKGTKDILSGLDTPVVMSFFVSKDKDNMPPELIPFTKRVESLLKQYKDLVGARAARACAKLQTQNISSAPRGTGRSEGRIFRPWGTAYGHE